MRILQMHRSLGAGGIEAMVCHLSNEMVKTDDVTVCTISTPSPNDPFYIRLSPKIHKETIGKNDGSNPLLVVFNIYRYILKGRFDIVQLHGFFYFYSLAIILLHKRTKFFYTVHSDASKDNNPWDVRLLSLKRFCFLKGWITPITISPASKASFSELYHCRSEMICNGIARAHIDTETDTVAEFRITPETKVFIHPGRISQEKNQVMLCRIFDRLVKEGADIALIIAGPLHFHDIYEQMSVYFSERVKYLGERGDILDLMSQCAGMCLCSQYEGLPVVLLEALSVGCIPVCTPVGGIVNVIKDHDNGILADEVSEEGYEQAMRTFLQLSDSERLAMRGRCKASFSDYDIEKTAGAYLELYHRQKIDV